MTVSDDEKIKAITGALNRLRIDLRAEGRNMLANVIDLFLFLAERDETVKLYNLIKRV